MNDELLDYFGERLEAFATDQGTHWIGIFQRDFSGHVLPLVTSAQLAADRELPSVAVCASDEKNVFHDKAEPFPGAGSDEVRSHGSLPVRLGSSTLGVLHAESRERGYFSHVRIAALEALASQLGALWTLPNSRAAIALDREMEKLKRAFPIFDWCGVYRRIGDTLYLSAFRGPATPHPVIPLDRGICGAAVSQNQTLNIPDVTADARYLACDSRTRSELVVPVRTEEGEPIAEIDIDSHTPSAFGKEIALHVEQLAREIAPLVSELV